MFNFYYSSPREVPSSFNLSLLGWYTHDVSNRHLPFSQKAGSCDLPHSVQPLLFTRQIAIPNPQYYSTDISMNQDLLSPPFPFSLLTNPPFPGQTLTIFS